MKIGGALVGSIFIVGTAIGFFILSLNWVIAFFQSHWLYLIWGLPVATLALAYFENLKLTQNFGGPQLIVDEIHHPRRPVPWLLAPWIYLMTLLFHLFGASVGRESTAIQMGASLSESGGRIMKIPNSDRPLLLRMGLAAGFGAAFGVPLAGAVFAMESPWPTKKRDWLQFPFFLGASMGAHLWTEFLFGSDHSLWQQLPTLTWTFKLPSYLLAILFFVFLCLSYEFLFQKIRLSTQKWKWWVLPGGSALLILAMTMVLSEPLFNNLGTPLLLQGFQQSATLSNAAGKLLFTLTSILGGMKGGEVTPLMASGTLFGSWLGSWLPGFDFQIGAALGMVSLFSLRLRIPLTATLMLWEIFDWKLAVLGFPLLFLNEFGRRSMSRF